MNFIKKHWFGAIVSLIVLSYVFLFILILFSPRQDREKRGFIPCTEAFMVDMEVCDGAWCTLKAVTKNSFCDFKIVGSGFYKWIKGGQSTPWENYIFEPSVEEYNNSDKEIAEFYENNPELLQDFQKIKQLNRDLQERIQKEIEGLEQLKKTDSSNMIENDSENADSFDAEDIDLEISEDAQGVEDIIDEELEIE